MNSTQKIIEKFAESRMQNTAESQSEATANVMAALEKLKKKPELELLTTTVAEPPA